MRNQLSEIEKPFWEEFMCWIYWIENMDLWGNLLSANDEAGLSEMTSILNEAVLMNDMLNVYSGELNEDSSVNINK